jgi:beta-galactosidase
MFLTDTRRREGASILKNARIRQSLDRNWKFYLGEAEGAERQAYDDRSWRLLHVPHDWSVEGDFEETNPTGGDGGYVPAGIGWYRKSFSAAEEWRGMEVRIQFDGIYMNSDVWINGHFLGHYPYGYSGFEYDLSPYLNDKEDNVIAVRVDNSDQPNSRWFTGSGIYRHTWLQVTDKLHVKQWGVFVSTPHITPQYAIVEIQTKVANTRDQSACFTLRSEIYAPDGRSVALCDSVLEILPGGVSEIKQTMRVSDHDLWTLEQPRLYRLRTVILQENTEFDEVITPFGIRSAVFDKDHGFLLNNQKVKMNGVCLHHDGGSVGAAVPERVWERRLELLKDMGCNAIRMSHNPPALELLDLCDRMGFLVMDEAFDEWTITKWKNGMADVHGYFEYFDEWAEKDLIMMLHRDRNHPSIVIWSIGNEIPEQKEPQGHQVARKLVEICHREDPLRAVTAACDNIEAEPVPATQAFLDTLDVIGYNYVARWRSRTETYYAEDRHRYPNRKFIGSENPGIGGVRGEYRLEPSEGDWWNGSYSTRMITAEQLWKFTRMHDYVSGDFMWTGIDYLGESRWPAKNAGSGVIDTCGFPKDGYYFYQSQWTDKPMVHLFPHWNWQGKEGKVLPVICYTNCDSAELFLNGKSFGMKAYEFPRQGMTKKWAHFEKKYIHVTTSDLHLTWDVPYETGTLKVVGYKDGVIQAESEITTTGKPYAVELIPDRSVIAADGRDVCHFTVRIVDANGHVVPTADSQLTFSIDGEGALIGVDNGKPDSHESYKTNRRRAFNGFGLALVQSTSQGGEIRITAESEGLKPDSKRIISITEEA